MFVELRAFALEDETWGTSNPICSDQGLTIFFLNGVFNTKASNTESLDGIRQAINRHSPHQETHEHILDENNVNYDSLWNISWWPLDVAVVALQKLKERQVIDGDVYKKLRAQAESTNDDLPNKMILATQKIL